MKKSVFIVIAIALLAVVFYGVRYVKKPVGVMDAKAVTRESSISCEGLIAYNESVYSAGVTGTFYSFAGEGERVGKDRIVATVYEGVVDKEVLQTLNNIDKKIVSLEAMESTSTTFVTDKSTEQAVVKDVEEDIIDSVIEEDVSQIPGYKSKLENTTGLVSDNDTQAELLKLRREKQEIEAKLGQNKRNIYSANSGIYTTSLDGLEGKLNPADLSWYMVADYRNLSEPEDGMIGNRTVQKGDAICKVVDNHTWYAVCIVKASDAERIEVGKSVSLRIKQLPGEVVSAKISYISPEPEGASEYLVVVKCEHYLEGVFNIRKSDIEIIFSSFYGYEVPIHAIRVQDGKNGVMVRKGNNEIFKECKILSRDDDAGTVMIEATGTTNSLEAGDLIVLGEK